MPGTPCALLMLALFTLASCAPVHISAGDGDPEPGDAAVRIDVQAQMAPDAIVGAGEEMVGGGPERLHRQDFVPLGGVTRVARD